jgi:hypothetical protein
MGGATAQAASSQVVRSWERNVGGSHENLDRNRNALGRSHGEGANGLRRGEAIATSVVTLTGFRSVTNLPWGPIQ